VRAFERGSAAPAAIDDTLLRPLRRLPSRQRDCIVLRYYGDLSYEQLADVMGIEPGTVGALLSKAHKALRAELEKGDHE
jgi:RNA polymerase sigma factor (sigma-70 family)